MREAVWSAGTASSLPSIRLIHMCPLVDESEGGTFSTSRPFDLLIVMPPFPVLFNNLTRLLQLVMAQDVLGSILL